MTASPASALNTASATPSLLDALPPASRVKPALMSMVSGALPLFLPKLAVASNEAIFAGVSTIVRRVLPMTLADAISPGEKTTSVLVLLPSMSQDSLVQSRRSLMSVLDVSPLDKSVSKLVPTICKAPLPTP